MTLEFRIYHCSAYKSNGNPENPTEPLSILLIGFILAKKPETVFNEHNLKEALIAKFDPVLLPLQLGKVLRGQYKSCWKAEKSNSSTRRGRQNIHFLLYSKLFVTFESGSFYLTS